MPPAPPPGPSSDSSSGSPQPASKGGTAIRIAVLVVVTALHALFTAGVLITAFLLLMIFLLIDGDDAIYLVLILIPAGVFTVVHWALVVFLRRIIGLPHPRTLAALLAVSTVLTCVQTALLADLYWESAVIAAFLTPVVAVVAFLARAHKVVWACVSVCGVALVYMLGFQGLEALTCTPTTTAEILRGTAPPDACGLNP